MPASQASQLPQKNRAQPSGGCTQLEWLDQKQGQGGLAADLMLEAELG
ncbi:hypothetical protein C4J83_3656 [Pseudomonas sp. LBUM920]|nr:hypothetical protein C4J83_3656 [Pseudomonas sp. LBUM920]